MEQATTIWIDLAKRASNCMGDGRRTPGTAQEGVAGAAGELSVEATTRHRGHGGVCNGARLGPGHSRAGARGPAHAADLRETVCAPSEERSRWRRGDRRGGLQANHALCGGEDRRAASAINDLSDARPAGAAANPIIVMSA